ncbi:MAG: META domain-containing protein [Verrucomicrobiota bacterium]
MKNYNACGLVAILFIVFSFFVSACTHQDPGALPEKGYYILFQLDGERPDVESPVELTLESGRFSGVGPVNRWQAPINGNRVGQIALTRMMGPPAQMSVEDRLMSALEGATVQLGSDGQLEFVQGDVVRAVFLPKSK